VSSLQGTVDVLGEDSSGESVNGVIRLANNIFLVLELDDDTNGAKDFLLNNLHIRLGVGENRRLNGTDGRISPDAIQRENERGYLDEVTLVSNTSTTKMDRGALLPARIDV